MMRENLTNSETDGRTTLPISGGPAADDGPDPFNPAALRLSQDPSTLVVVKKVLAKVPCRKPNRHEFFRVRSGEECQLETAAYEDKANRDLYLVEQRLWPELGCEVIPVCLFLTVNRNGDVALWPAKLPGADGRSNAWYDSALAAAKIAEKRWVRISSNMSAGMYDVHEALGQLPEPQWPDLSFQKILELCFRDRLIRSMDHPVLRALRGEV